MFARYTRNCNDITFIKENMDVGHKKPVFILHSLQVRLRSRYFYGVELYRSFHQTIELIPRNIAYRLVIQYMIDN